MKKVLGLVLFLALTVTAVFAAPEFQMSAGGGIQTEISAIGAVDGSEKAGFKSSGFDIMPGFGGFVFFDATYLEAAIGFSGGVLSYYINPSEGATETMDGSFTAMNFSLLGKYPFELGKFTIFPMLGIDYALFLSAKFDDTEDEDGFDAADLNTLWFKAGVGGDFALTEQLYLRGTALFGFGTPNKFAKDYSEEDGIEATSSIGFTIKLAVGYKF